MDYEALKNLFRGNAFGRKFRPKAVCMFVEDFPRISCGGFAVVNLADLKENIIKATKDPKNLYVLGRGDGCDFDLTTCLNEGAADNSVSRYHCYVERQKTPKGEQFVLYDCSMSWTAVVDD